MNLNLYLPFFKLYHYPTLGSLDLRPPRSYAITMSLSYPVVLIKSEEGYAIGCPALPGCWSQGATEDEALQNIRGAIQDYLAAVTDSLKDADVREVEVAF